jgi:hypothetical protein
MLRTDEIGNAVEVRLGDAMLFANAGGSGIPVIDDQAGRLGICTQGSSFQNRVTG